MEDPSVVYLNNALCWVEIAPTFTEFVEKLGLIDKKMESPLILHAEWGLLRMENGQQFKDVKCLMTVKYIGEK